MVELNEVMGAIASFAGAVADSLISGFHALYSAGMPNGLDPGALAGGALAGGVAGGAFYPYPDSGWIPSRDPAGYDGVYRRGTGYRTSDGKPYFPGSSPIPSDGVVYEKSMAIPGEDSRGPQRRVAWDTGKVVYRAWE